MSIDLGKNFMSRSINDTFDYAKQVVVRLNCLDNTTNVLGLVGDLGAGKTNLTQGIARALGVKERVTSPTFVLMKVYNIPIRQNILNKFKRLVHIDAYRLHGHSDLHGIGVTEYMNDNETLMIIEWADRVKGILPEQTAYLQLEHISEDERRISYSRMC